MTHSDIFDISSEAGKAVVANLELGICDTISHHGCDIAAVAYLG